VEGFSLTIAVLSDDDALRGELARSCAGRSHVVVELLRLRELRRVAAPDVLVLDVPDALAVARTVSAVQPHTTVVIVGEGRSLEGFRVVDRWRTGNRLCDELELAYIGIPAGVELEA
jgi:hypothetical protein